MGGDRDAVPWPPHDPPSALPPLRDDRTPEMWRLHWEDDPNLRSPSDPGRWRFDAPLGEYPVTYANEDRHHAFIEVYGDTDGSHDIPPNQAGRMISRCAPARPLRLIDFGDAMWLSALGLDGRISTTIDYARTQAWSLMLHRWLDVADGIRYPGRKAGRRDNFCFFLDRCADALAWEAIGTIAEQRGLVLVACEMFRLVPRVFVGPPTPDWP